MKPFFCCLLAAFSLPLLLHAQDTSSSLAGPQTDRDAQERLALLIERSEAAQHTAPDDALAYAREAHTLLTRFPDPLLEARLLFSTGYAHYRVNAFDSVRVYAEHLEALADPSGDHRVRALHLRGYALRERGRHEEAREAFSTALAHYTAQGHEPAMMDAAQALGMAHRDLGDYDTALAFFDQALRLSERLGDQSRRAHVLNTIGITHRRQGNYDTALDFYHQALQLREALGERRGVAGLLNNIGIIHRLRGELDEALDFFNRSLALKEALGEGMTRSTSSTLTNIGNLYETTGDYDAALTAFSRGLEISEAVGDQRGIAVFLNNIGDIHRDHGDLEAARQAVERALAIHEALNNSEGISFALNNLGLIAERQGQLDEALTLFTRSLALKEAIGNPRRQANTLLNIGNIHRKQGHLDSAQVFFERAMTKYTSAGHAEGVVMALTSLGSVHQAAGRLEEALPLTERAAVLADSIGTLPKLRTAYEQQATLLELLDRPAEALAALRAFIAVDDSLFHSESQGVVAELQAQYRTREQQQRIALLESNRRQQRLWVVVLGGGVGLLVVIMALLAGRMRQRRHALAAIEKARQAEAERTEELEQANDDLHHTTEELEQANADLQRTAEALEQANELKSRFLANISHEFRTPLTLTFGPLDDLLSGRFASLDEARPHLQTARRNGGRLLRLINQLLDLSKLDAGALLLHAHTHDLTTHLHSLAALFEPIAQNRQIQFNTLLPDASTPHVYDSDKIEKVVLNLLSNAFKFTEPGGKIVLTFEQAANGVARIEVVDTGPGIAEEHLPHLFDRFYQIESETTRLHEGTGIGLALAKELVELHGGTITVESKPTFGTTFTVCLPPLEPTAILAAGDGQYGEAVQAEGATPDKDTTRIVTDALEGPATPRSDHGHAGTTTQDPGAATVVLVVEDNADMRAYIRSHLEDLVTVVEAEHGQAGLEQAIEDVPDLVVSDVMIPEMDGLDLCQALKQDERTSHIPVLLLTARAQVEHRIAGFESGADAYLSKPFSAEELRVRVRTLIAERRRLRQRFAARGIVPMEIGDEKAELEPMPPREAAFVAKVEATVTKHLANTEFGVDHLAEALLLSRRQLFRKLRALTDETPGALIRRMRVARAAELLDEGADTIKEVMYAVGFQSSSSFRKAFRQVYGMTPTDYQDQTRIAGTKPLSLLHRK